jgi:hypothetical protein
MWKWQSPHFVNEKGKVIDVSGGKDAENAAIIAWNKHGKLN